MERTSQLERSLFKAVRLFMLVAAVLALLVGIGSALNGFIKSGATADDKLKAPSISFEEYSNQLERQKKAQDTAAEEKSKPVPKKPVERDDPNAVPAEFLDVLNEIEKHVSGYAQKTGQPIPAPAFRSKVYRESLVFSRNGFQRDFLNKVAQLTKSLDSAGEKLAKLDDADPRKIFWGRLLDYAHARYTGDLQRQMSEIRKAQSEADQKRNMASREYMRAGGSLGLFLILTLLLVLLSIEQNTYATSMTLRGRNPGSQTKGE